MEKCQFRERDDPVDISTGVLESPKKRDWGMRYFCIYNFSLTCPEGESDVEITQIVDNRYESWPGKNKNCGQNYLRFYTDRNSNSNHKFCGQDHELTNYKILNRNSFMAILWTNDVTSGYFKFQASCATSHDSKPQLASTSPMTSPTTLPESSGNGGSLDSGDQDELTLNPLA